MSDVSFVSMRAVQEDCDRIRASFLRNGNTKPPLLIEWQHLQNPNQPPQGVFGVPAGDASKTAAIYLTMRVQMSAPDGSVFDAAQSLDTLTDIDFRRMGLFVRGAKATYERCAEAGLGLVYGFPNGNSCRGFRKLDWTIMDPVPFLVRPIRPRYFLERIKRLAPVVPFVPNIPATLPIEVPAFGAELKEISPAELTDEHGNLALGFTRGHYAVCRDRDYLRWRLQRPHSDYRILELRRGGRLLGFGAYCVKGKHGGKVGYIMELMAEGRSAKHGAMLLHAMTHRMARAGADAVLAWSMEHQPFRKLFRTFGYLPMPERLRPIELHFGAYPLAPAHRAATERARWYLSYLDSDTV